MNTPLRPERSQAPGVPAFEAGLKAHCRRVAAMSLEISARLRLPSEHNHILEKAALLHHLPAALLEERTTERFLTDLFGKNWRALLIDPAPPSGGLQPPRGIARPLPPPVYRRSEPASGAAEENEIRDVLKAVRRPSPQGVEDKATLFAQILQMANLFDEQIEYLAYEHRTIEQILDELRWVADDGFCHPAIVSALASLPRAKKEQLLEVVYRLPVYPAVALKTLALTAQEDVSVPMLEKLVSSDQVLAGNLIKVANSPLFSPARPIANLRLAITYLGMETTRKVLMGVVLQPLFASVKLRNLWAHSLQIAQFTERMARVSGRSDPDEAFLAGLVHDVGRLAVERLSGEVPAAYVRLTERGCAPVYAELVLWRFDHGELGGDILRNWNFPEPLAEAVRYHHAPEQADNDLSWLLYVAEQWCGVEPATDAAAARRSESDEDLPSVIRWERGLQKAGLTMAQLSEIEKQTGALDALIVAA
jgi:putative nucleotidyltransferase with HDIG domain